MYDKFNIIKRKDIYIYITFLYIYVYIFYFYFEIMQNLKNF